MPTTFLGGDGRVESHPRQVVLGGFGPITPEEAWDLQREIERILQTLQREVNPRTGRWYREDRLDEIVDDIYRTLRERLESRCERTLPRTYDGLRALAEEHTPPVRLPDRPFRGKRSARYSIEELLRSVTDRD